MSTVTCRATCHTERQGNSVAVPHESVEQIHMVHPVVNWGFIVLPWCFIGVASAVSDFCTTFWDGQASETFW